MVETICFFKFPSHANTRNDFGSTTFLREKEMGNFKNYAQGCPGLLILFKKMACMESDRQFGTFNSRLNLAGRKKNNQEHVDRIPKKTFDL